MNTENFLENMQLAVDRCLNGSKALADVPVLSRQQSDIQKCLEEFSQTGIGLCLLVLNPIPLKVASNGDKIAFEELSVRVQIIENPCTRGGQPGALFVAEHISKYLHNFQPKLDGWVGWLSLEEKLPWKEIKDPEKRGRYIVEVNFKATGSLIDENNV